MKKLILSAAILAFAGFSTIEAYAYHPTIAISYNIQDTTKTPVKLEELPEAVKKVLASDEFKEWTPSAAFLVKTDKGAEYYQIDVKNGEKAGSLNVDKDGKAVQEEAAAGETAPDATTPPTQPAPDATETPAPDATETPTESTPATTTPPAETAPDATTPPTPAPDGSETAPERTIQ